MADGVFNIAKGAVAEKVRDAASNLGMLLLKANETEADLVDHADLTALLGAVGNTEADATNYVRKTALTGTINVDNTNNRTDVDVPDQTWTSLGGATNNTLTKLIIFYDEGGTDSTRIPLTHHDFSVTTDGTDLTAQVNAAGFFRAS
ncbi:MAG: hypothetical protein ACE5FD_03570 [Anaerolineae bacterium]